MIVKTEIIFNRNLDKYKKGDKVKIEINGFWRNRLKDGDISIYEEKIEETKKEEKDSEKTNEMKETKKKLKV